MKLKLSAFDKDSGLQVLPLLQDLEMEVCEGVLQIDKYPEKIETNIFNRRVKLHPGQDLDFILGMAYTGLRTAAIIEGSRLVQNIKQLSLAIQAHLPLVVHHNFEDIDFATKQRIDFNEPKTSFPDTFNWSVTNFQELVDFTIISHRVAELSLLPVIQSITGILPNVIIENLNIPQIEDIQNFLGTPDDYILNPTPAQKIIFGNRRRRIPAWYNLDFPTFNRAVKDSYTGSFQSAAQREYFLTHLPEIFELATTEYNKFTGRLYRSISTHRTKDAQYILISTGPIFNQVKEVVDKLRQKNKFKVGAINLRVVNPLPIKDLKSVINGKKGITILESSEFIGSPQSLSNVLKNIKLKGTKIFTGNYYKSTNSGLSECFQNMMPGGSTKNDYYLEMDFTRESSQYPRQEILFQEIDREYPTIRDKTLKNTQLVVGTSANIKKGEIDFPDHLRRFHDEGPPYTQLSRFYSTAGIFYRSPEMVKNLIADPFSAIPVLPPASAVFFNVEEQRKFIPTFQPDLCTGCGACFTYCPHSAIPPLVIRTEELIKRARDLSGKQGENISGITPYIKNLAREVNNLIRDAESPGRTLESLLPEAWKRLIGKLKLSSEKEKEITNVVDIIRKILSDFPFSATEYFFNQLEKHEKGSGQLFSLAIDLNSCTGCGICIQMCKENALVETQLTPDIDYQTRSTFKLWEKLPDTEGEIITRMYYDPNYDPISATLLSRNFYFSLVGGGAIKQESAKALVHHITAITESVTQPRVREQIKEIAELIDNLSENIHHYLAETLPSHNFETLTQALSGLSDSRLPADEILTKYGAIEHLKIVDADTLRRKIDLLNALKDLSRMLTKGPSGSGRSRYGVILGNVLKVHYPFHSFMNPVIYLPEGVRPDLIMGIMEGQIRHFLDNLKLVHRARLEVKNKYNPDINDQQIADLNWNDLPEGDRSWLPPLLVFGKKEFLIEKQFPAFHSLLTRKLPIKIFVLEINSGRSIEKLTSEIHRSALDLFSIFTHKNISSLAASWADNQKLFTGIVEGLRNMSPGVFFLFAPDSRKHDLLSQDWVGLASLALHTRAFPWFQFLPISDDKEFLCEMIGLEDNPDLDQDWVTVELKYEENKQEKIISYQLTPADWFFNLADYQDLFPKASETEKQTLPLAKYLQLAERDRQGKIPVIFRVDLDGNLEKRVIAPGIVSACQEVLWNWHRLRELGGLLTPYPVKLKNQVEKELTEKYERKFADLAAEYDQKLKDQEQKQLEKMKKRLKNKLIELTKIKKQS